MSTISDHRTTVSNTALSWTLLAIALVVNGAGYLLSLYDRFAWFDEVIHAYSSFALALVVALYVYGRVLMGARHHPILFGLIITTIAVGMGGVWEVLEWIYDRYTTQQNTIKEAPDRLVDLLMDALGGGLAGWATIGMVKRQGGDGSTA